MDNLSISKKNLIILLCVFLAIIIGIVAIFVIYNITSDKSNAEAKNKPFNITVSGGGDVANSVDITWTTTASSRGSYVQYVKKQSENESKPDFEKIQSTLYEGYMEEADLMFPVSGQEYEQYPEMSASNMVIHRCFITGLEADTSYWYRVGDRNSGLWSDVYTFTTAYSTSEMSEDGFDFLLYADSQGFLFSEMEVWQKVLETSCKTYPDVDFMVHMGDFVETANNGLLWQYALNLAPDEIRNKTFFPVVGNKDLTFVTKYFTVGAESDSYIYNGWYSFDYEGVHFTVVNTGDETDITKQQIKWIKKDLAAAKDALWKVVLIHKAPYSDANHADDPDVVYLRQELMPLFEQYEVDVVIQGHDHFYFRSEPVENGEVTEYTKLDNNIITDVKSPVYFINGSAGIKQYSKTFRDMTGEIHTAYRDLLLSPSFSYCKVSERSIVFETYTVNRYTGEMNLVESWGIQK